MQSLLVTLEIFGAGLVLTMLVSFIIHACDPFSHTIILAGVASMAHV